MALRHRARHDGIRGARALHQPRPLHAWLRAGAKASPDITYWPAALRAGVELRPDCRVREITTDAAGMATGAVYYDAAGAECFQPAHIVILACNGVGTPRILLNSTSGKYPNGLANSSGLVGRNLMFHPFAQAYGFAAEEIDGYRGLPLSLWSKEFYETDPARGFLRGYTLHSSAAAAWSRKPWRRPRRDGCPGARTITAPSASGCSTAASASPQFARTCRRSTTGSRSTRC
ncbi:GMC family oxidoreductase N-terminal domain-containing protein [Dankookia sp. P2]|uniref:GMC family oxidoreductase N-terminal domain-containing protein n=1 Tax=Dankookia sp. P2 TaxID=3423955 RepID=UPI003D67A273